MTGKTKRIVCIGECMLELAETGEGTYRLGFAGDTLNTAWYLRARLPQDWRVDYFTALGTDTYSDEILSFFDKNGIGKDKIVRVADRRPGLYIIAQVKGDRHFTYWRGQSAAKLLADNVAKLKAAVANADLIYFSGITLAILAPAARQRLMKVLKAARKAGAKLAFDPNERPALWPSIATMKKALNEAVAISDFAFPTFPDERHFFGDKTPEALARRYMKLGAGEVVAKNGAAPALVAKGRERFEVGPRAGVKVVDATAAGDSFNGGYLAARLQGAGPAEAASAAHQVAGIVIGHRGALVPKDRLTN